MKLKPNYLLIFFFLICIIPICRSQGSLYYDGGFKIKFGENKDKFLRIISWVQAQYNYSEEVPENESNYNFQLRRARLLLIGQITKDFTIVTHLGLNNLNANTMSPTGVGDGSQLFMHDAWAQYNFNEKLSVGGGLHYFNGVSRLNNQSTLNMLTLDNNRASWATLGLSDQFARHIGVFAKGKLGKLEYQLAINDASASSLDTRQINSTNSVYSGRSVIGSKTAGKTYAGYFSYNFLDQESNYLPYKVGSYLGTKSVFNLGAGFFMHPNGSVIFENLEPKGEDVSIFAIDAFFDQPLGSLGAALTAYAVFQKNDYGTNYLFGPYGTGSMFYSHVGYLLSTTKTDLKLQPYASISQQSFDISEEDRTILGIGINAYFSGHNSKLTLEYKNEKFGDVEQTIVGLQAMIYL
ncbi:porin [Psychroflexus sp. ALD_RP9]|uniref:porin n=1 Tax=Psychroflexus sp. ALD_RP9 TaxID=2777186 RepID=UPI001A8FAB15|nr:porin [Psychroflexus sp. ALD_RP9]QSS97040.1 hypothetical protein IMZ30_11445 [Psychroflexus sp. ALD_RP9]